MAQPARPSERRRAPRVPIDGERLRWSPIVAGTGRPPDRAAEYARVVDMSTTGALVVAPFDPRVRIGTHVSIEAGGARGFVQVRRIEDSQAGDLVAYGVQFVHLDAPLRQLVSRMMASSARS